MTKEELREHCEKQVKMCEEWAKGNNREPSGKIYEEHKLILDLIKSSEQQPSEDKVSVEVYKQVMSERDIAIEQLRELGYSFGEKIRTSDNCVSRQAVKEGMIKYGFHAPDMTVTEFVEDELPPVTPTHGTCKDCKHNYKTSRNTFECSNGHRFYMRIPDTFYCADYEKRGSENA